MKWDDPVTITLSAEHWSSIKCALWDSYGKWVSAGNDTMAEHTAGLRNMIHEQLPSAYKQ